MNARETLEKLVAGMGDNMKQHTRGIDAALEDAFAAVPIDPRHYDYADGHHLSNPEAMRRLRTLVSMKACTVRAICTDEKTARAYRIDMGTEAEIPADYLARATIDLDAGRVGIWVPLDDTALARRAARRAEMDRRLSGGHSMEEIEREHQAFKDWCKQNHLPIEEGVTEVQDWQWEHLSIIDTTAEKRQRGRKPKYTWTEFSVECMALLERHGIPKPNRTWNFAKIFVLMETWSHNHWGEERAPGSTSIKDHIQQCIDTYSKRRQGDGHK
jgi:hypothetical protein